MIWTYVAGQISYLRRALYNEGQFVLKPAYQIFSVPRHNWLACTPHVKEKFFLSFLRGRPELIPDAFETSSDRVICLPQKSALAKKPT